MEEKNKKDINRRDFIKIVGISAARICRLYGLQVWAVQPAYVGYINTTVPNRLLSCQIQVIIL